MEPKKNFDDREMAARIAVVKGDAAHGLSEVLAWLAGKSDLHVGPETRFRLAFKAARLGVASVLEDLHRRGFEADQAQLGSILREVIDDTKKVGPWETGGKGCLESLIAHYGKDHVERYRKVWFQRRPPNVSALRAVREQLGDLAALESLISVAKERYPLHEGLEALLSSGMPSEAIGRFDGLLPRLFSAAGGQADYRAVEMLVEHNLVCEFSALHYVAGAARTTGLAGSSAATDHVRAFRTLLEHDPCIEDEIEHVTLFLEDYRNINVMDALFSVPFMGSMSTAPRYADWPAACAAVLVAAGYPHEEASGAIPHVAGQFKDMAVQLAKDPVTACWSEVVNAYRRRAADSTTEHVHTRDRKIKRPGL